MVSQLTFNGKTYDTHPLFGTESRERDLSFNYAHEVENITFSNKDADLIINAGYETEFTLWDGKNRYKFYYRNCTVRRYDRVVIVSKVETIDNYFTVKGLMDTEVNIADNKYKKKVLTLPYAPIIQFYIGGGRFTNIVNDIVFDTSSSGDPLPTSSNPQGENGWYGFRNSAIYGVNTIIKVQSTDPFINGTYSPSGVGNFTAAKWENGSIVAGSKVLAWVNDSGSGDANSYVLINNGDFANPLYKSEPIYQFPTNPMWDESNAFGEPIILTNVNDSTDKILVYSYANPKFRILLAKEDYAGWETVALPTDDAIPNSAYTHALKHITTSQYNQLYDLLGYNVEQDNQNWDFAEIFDEERGVYGKADEDSLQYANQYFVKPSASSDQFGMMSEYWKYGSAFFTIKSDLRDLLVAGHGEQRALFYDFEDVLSQMSGLPVKSSFLNGISPLKDGRKLYLSPLSNVKVRNYEEPSSKLILKLSDMFQFLKEVYNCEWDVDREELRVEHYSWYDKGGSYESKRVVLDLVNETNAFNLKSVYSDEFSFVSGDAKKHKIWKFQNEHNPIYEATVTVENVYVEDGNEEKTIGKMNVDLISILLTDVSDDGVLVIEVDSNDNIIFEGKLINGGLAMTNAIGKYHLYGESGAETNYGTSKSRARIKEETITHSLDVSDVQGLVRTREGNGKIHSITVDNEGVTQIKLRHDKY